MQPDKFTSFFPGNDGDSLLISVSNQIAQSESKLSRNSEAYEQDLGARRLRAGSPRREIALRLGLRPNAGRNSRSDNSETK